MEISNEITYKEFQQRFKIKPNETEMERVKGSVIGNQVEFWFRNKKESLLYSYALIKWIIKFKKVDQNGISVAIHNNDRFFVKDGYTVNNGVNSIEMSINGQTHHIFNNADYLKELSTYYTSREEMNKIASTSGGGWFDNPLDDLGENRERDNNQFKASHNGGGGGNANWNLDTSNPSVTTITAPVIGNALQLSVVADANIADDCVITIRNTNGQDDEFEIANGAVGGNVVQAVGGSPFSANTIYLVRRAFTDTSGNHIIEIREMEDTTRTIDNAGVAAGALTVNNSVGINVGDEIVAVANDNSYQVWNVNTITDGTHIAVDRDLATGVVYAGAPNPIYRIKNVRSTYLKSEINDGDFLSVSDSGNADRIVSVQNVDIEKFIDNNVWKVKEIYFGYRYVNTYYKVTNVAGAIITLDIKLNLVVGNVLSIYRADGTLYEGRIGSINPANNQITMNVASGAITAGTAVYIYKNNIIKLSYTRGLVKGDILYITDKSNLTTYFKTTINQILNYNEVSINSNFFYEKVRMTGQLCYTDRKRVDTAINLIGNANATKSLKYCATGLTFDSGNCALVYENTGLTTQAIFGIAPENAVDAGQNIHCSTDVINEVAVGDLLRIATQAGGNADVTVASISGNVIRMTAGGIGRILGAVAIQKTYNGITTAINGVNTLIEDRIKVGTRLSALNNGNQFKFFDVIQIKDNTHIMVAQDHSAEAFGNGRALEREALAFVDSGVSVNVAGRHSPDYALSFVATGLTVTARAGATITSTAIGGNLVIGDTIRLTLGNNAVYIGRITGIAGNVLTLADLAGGVAIGDIDVGEPITKGGVGANKITVDNSDGIIVGDRITIEDATAVNTVWRDFGLITAIAGNVLTTTNNHATVLFTYNKVFQLDSIYFTPSTLLVAGAVAGQVITTGNNANLVIVGDTLRIILTAGTTYVGRVTALAGANNINITVADVGLVAIGPMTVGAVVYKGGVGLNKITVNRVGTKYIVGDKIKITDTTANVRDFGLITAINGNVLTITANHNTRLFAINAKVNRYGVGTTSITYSNLANALGEARIQSNEFETLQIQDDGNAIRNFVVQSINLDDERIIVAEDHSARVFTATPQIFIEDTENYTTELNTSNNRKFGVNDILLIPTENNNVYVPAQVVSKNADNAHIIVNVDCRTQSTNRGINQSSNPDDEKGEANGGLAGDIFTQTSTNVLSMTANTYNTRTFNLTRPLQRMPYAVGGNVRATVPNSGAEITFYEPVFAPPMNGFIPFNLDDNNMFGRLSNVIPHIKEMNVIYKFKSLKSAVKDMIAISIVGDGGANNRFIEIDKIVSADMILRYFKPPRPLLEYIPSRILLPCYTTQIYNIPLITKNAVQVEADLGVDVESEIFRPREIRTYAVPDMYMFLIKLDDKKTNGTDNWVNNLLQGNKENYGQITNFSININLKNSVVQTTLDNVELYNFSLENANNMGLYPFTYEQWKQRPTILISSGQIGQQISSSVQKSTVIKYKFNFINRTAIASARWTFKAIHFYENYYLDIDSHTDQYRYGQYNIDYEEYKNVSLDEVYKRFV